jgi:hypothetical protein
METNLGIRNAERLSSIFGRWSSFHDAGVVWLQLDRRASSLGAGPTLGTLIHVFEMTSEVSSEGFYILRNHVLVHLRFSRVVELIFEGFNHQNALMSLRIEDIQHRRMERINFEVTFTPAFGIEASFQCQEIEVVDVQPCNSKGAVE